jgi:hypothetical protein
MPRVPISGHFQEKRLEVPMRLRSASIPMLLLALASAAAAAPLRVVTYNTFGLPPISGLVPDRSAEFAAMAPLLEGLHADGTPTVVALQEVFYAPYYDTLTSPVAVSYADVTAKDAGGPNGIGDGLTLMSDAEILSFARTQWNDCFGASGLAGSDCDTNKGFLFARLEAAPGVEVDLYQLHADAGTDAGSTAARIANLLQLSAAIQANSAGRAVIVLGDTNSRYTRSAENFGQILGALGLEDAWIESALGGAIPGFGSNINGGCPPPRGNATGGAVDASGSSCELVDKILFRSGDDVSLALLGYDVPLHFVDGAGAPLSDHLPVAALFDVQRVPEPSLAALLLVGAAIARRRARG